jgi:hypothetical protein
MVTPLDFAKALTNSLGVPASSNNLAAIVAWEAQEGGNYVNHSIQHNPLNTSLGGFGGTPVTGVGIMSYPTWSDGLAATAATLKGSAYAGVRQALAVSADPSDTLQAINDSPWLGYQSAGRSQYSTNWQAYQYYANTPDPVGGSLGIFAQVPHTVIIGGLLTVAVAGWFFRDALIHSLKTLRR